MGKKRKKYKEGEQMKERGEWERGNRNIYIHIHAYTCAHACM